MPFTGLLQAQGQGSGCRPRGFEAGGSPQGLGAPHVGAVFADLCTSDYLCPSGLWGGGLRVQGARHSVQATCNSAHRPRNIRKSSQKLQSQSAHLCVCVWVCGWGRRFGSLTKGIWTVGLTFSCKTVRMGMKRGCASLSNGRFASTAASSCHRACFLACCSLSYRDQTRNFRQAKSLAAKPSYCASQAWCRCRPFVAQRNGPRAEAAGTR